MMKLLPDAAQRLGRRLIAGPVEHRLKALHMTQELGLAEVLREAVMGLTSHSHPKVRSKAISVLGEVPSAGTELLVERIVSDADSRVRANAIEVLENRRDPQLIPLLFERAKNATNRERANAIKALNKMRVGNVGPVLQAMLQDQRPEHRISAMWALKQMGWWKLLQERRAHRQGGHQYPGPAVCRGHTQKRRGNGAGVERSGVMKSEARRDKAIGRWLAIGGLIVLSASQVALANPTQEEFFRSLNQNINSPVDMSKAVPYLLATLGLVILAVLFNQYRQRQSSPRALNHSGKLTRELTRRLSLRSVELRQLKLLAEEQQIEHPLTLILCPSVLGKAIRAPSARVDRVIVRQIVQRLRESLAKPR